NPLASLSGYLQLASRYARSEDMRERVAPAIDEAEHQVARLLRLADDLQVISSPSAVFRVEPEPLDLAMTAHAAARRVEALDPSHRERIFERFARGASVATQPCMGIGLYVSRAIAMGMGGRLFIEESSSQGTVFAVELPLAPVEADLAPDLAGVAD